MMLLKVREKEFKIELVNNWVHEKYADMLEYIGQLQESRDTIDRAFIETKDPDIIRGKLRDEAKKLNTVKRFISEARRDIVKEIVTTNGYEYDASWWTHRTGVEDTNDFMLACILKDQTSGTKKNDLAKKK